jgi:hypothetical protein
MPYICLTVFGTIKKFFKNAKIYYFELWSAVNFEHPGLVIVALAPGA